jgi:hypothetical protein
MRRRGGERQVRDKNTGRKKARSLISILPRHLDLASGQEPRHKLHLLSAPIRVGLAILRPLACCVFDIAPSSISTPRERVDSEQRIDCRAPSGETFLELDKHYV